MASSRRPKRAPCPSKRARESGFAISPITEHNRSAPRARTQLQASPDTLSFADIVDNQEEQSQQQQQAQQHRGGSPLVSSPAAGDTAVEVNEEVEVLPGKPVPASSRWPPKATKKWSTGAKVALLQLALRHEIWPKSHKNDKQKERKKAFEAECREGMYGPLFEGKSDAILKSMYSDCLKRKRAYNAQEGPSASGSSPPPIADEFKPLDKAAGQLVDTISAATLQVNKEKQLSEKEENERTACIHASRDKGMQNCQPSPGAMPFPLPTFRPGRGGGRRSSSSGSTDGGSVTGDSGPCSPDGNSSESGEESPSFLGVNRLTIQDSQHLRSVPAMYASVVAELAANGGTTGPPDHYQAITGTSDADITRFFQDGWVGDELEPAVAVTIMTAFIYTLSNTVPGGKANWNGSGGGDAVEDRMDWEDIDFIGMKKCLPILCSHYEADLDHLKAVTTSSAFKLYSEGWKGDQLPSKVVDYLNQTLALLLLTGDEYELEEDEENSGRANGKGKKRIAKSGRKTRVRKHRTTEDSLTRLLSSLAHSAARDQKAVRDAEAKYRKEKTDQIERLWVQEQEVRKKERQEDATIRREEREEAARIRKEERDEAARVRQEEKEIRDHEYRILLLKMRQPAPGPGGAEDK